MRALAAVFLCVASCSAFGAQCLSLGGLPDPRCTPGALNPAVTQATLSKTVCKPGWSAAVRPSTSYTNKLKLRSIREYGWPRGIRSYEGDHDVPLTAGGSPTSTKNIWAEPRYGDWNSLDKDRLEWRLHRMLCHGEITLAQDQYVWLTSWKDGYQEYICSTASKHARGCSHDH